MKVFKYVYKFFLVWCHSYKDGVITYIDLMEGSMHFFGVDTPFLLQVGIDKLGILPARDIHTYIHISQNKQKEK